LFDPKIEILFFAILGRNRNSTQMETSCVQKKRHVRPILKLFFSSIEKSQLLNIAISSLLYFKPFFSTPG